MEVPGRRSEVPFKGQEERSSVEDSKVFCQPCSSDEDWAFAVGYCQNCSEYFCQTCLKLHCKQSISKHHVILEGENMPGEKVSSHPLGTCSEFCSRHTNEILKFYCPSHDDVGCGDCIVLEHNTCRVERIQDISSNYYNGPEHGDLQRKVEQLCEDIKNVAKEMKESNENKNESYSKALEDISAFRKEINDHFDRAEAEIIADLNNRREEDEQLLSKLTKMKQCLERDIMEMQKKLQLQSNKANDVFVAAKKIKKQIARTDSSVKQMLQNCQIHVDQYRFKPSSHIKNIISSATSLGDVTEYESLKTDQSVLEDQSRRDTGKLTECRSKNHSDIKSLEDMEPEQEDMEPELEDMEPKFESAIQIISTEDTSDCAILASAIISPSKIVLADCANYCVKIVDTEKKKLEARYELSSQPKDVATICENQLAVLLPDEQEILILTLIHNMFTEIRRIKIKYWGGKILFQKGTFITAYDHGVDILDTDGKLIKTIPTEQHKFLKSIAFAPDSMSFYASYFCQTSLTWPNIVQKYDLAGNRLAEYTSLDENLESVRGITVAKDGTVIMCNYGANLISGNIHLLSPDCKLIKEVLTNNNDMNPFCVSFCDETKRLFLCNKDIIHPYRNNVLKVFQMK
ncbi:uncharacterized protein LOC128550725 [Mercenaria mercenaria]|uniref:uncharacterized protein LOC128550725 n=1 Tax=Mercenaria mercenaria TaxID=6596 RepID=UPI00234F9C55|nr:uncharacterized protein LOC128550725 [Mercenaria mercenaria]